jgi:prepilin-type N-terminal cleavage/methylation domain-containing protein
MRRYAVRRGHARKAPLRAPRPARRDDGYTLVELLVAMSLFLVLSAVVFSAVITMSKALDRERVTSDITAEARVALERMARELRQANNLDSAQPNSMRVFVDFDGDGVNSGTLDDPEIVTYAYDASTHSIKMTGQDASGNTIDAALLAGQVKSLTFTYSSSNWAKDANHDGTVTLAEAGADGVDRVDMSLVVEQDDHDEVFKTQVTLRNRSQT